MVFNYNDKLRSAIFKDQLITESIKIIYNAKPKLRRKYLEIIYLDYLKMKYYKSVYYGEIFVDVKFDLNNLENNDSDLLAELLAESYCFSTLDYISKCVLFKLLNNSDMDEELSNISKIHILDKLTYNINYDIDSFKEYYFDYIRTHLNEKNFNYEERCNAMLDFFSNQLDFLVEEDELKYNLIILKCVSKYYKFNIFLNKVKPNEINYNSYTGYIEEFSLDDILELARYDKKFLKEILKFYFYYPTNKELCRQIDSYFESSTSIEVQKKLKIKNTNN